MFLVAILSNLISSYFIASIFGNFLIIFIAFFALIVLNIELLSLFSAIKETNILILSIINLVITSFFFFYKKTKPIKINFDFKRLLNSFLLDKHLILLLIGFIILILVSLYLAIIMPVMEPDSQTYHFIRAYEFLKQGSLAHFETNDVRALIMPINSEIIYTWMLAFKRNFYGF